MPSLLSLPARMVVLSLSLLAFGALVSDWGCGASSLSHLAWSAPQDDDGDSSSSNDESGDEASPSDVKTPSFDDASGQEAFDKGRQHFDKGEWKAAEKSFKACRSAVEKDDRDLLKSWTAACKGGTKLAAIEKSVAKESWLKAWNQLEKVDTSYGKTPLRSHLDKLYADIEPKLFMVLANYEEPAPEPQTEAGAPPATAKRVGDKELARRGDGSLRWRENVGLGTGKLLGFLPLAKFEGGTLSQCTHLWISIYSESKDHGKFTLLLDNGDLNNRNPLEILKENVYFHHLTINHVGWKDYRIDLRKEFATLANPIPDEMQRLSLLIIPPSKPKIIRVDEVKFERSSR